MSWKCYICSQQGCIHKYWVPEINRSILWCDECSADWESWEDFFSKGAISGTQGVLNRYGLNDYECTLEPVGNFWILWFDKARHLYQAKAEVLGVTYSNIQSIFEEQEGGFLHLIDRTFVVSPKRAQSLAKYLDPSFKFDFEHNIYFVEFDEELNGRIEIEESKRDYITIFARQIELVLGGT